MSPTLTIFLLLTGWLAVAATMLWGVMRVSRRHHHPQTQLKQQTPPDKPVTNTASVSM